MDPLPSPIVRRAQIIRWLAVSLAAISWNSSSCSSAARHASPPRCLPQCESSCHTEWLWLSWLVSWRRYPMFTATFTCLSRERVRWYHTGQDISSRVGLVVTQWVLADTDVLKPARWITNSQMLGVKNVTLASVIFMLFSLHEHKQAPPSPTPTTRIHIFLLNACSVKRSYRQQMCMVQRLYLNSFTLW